MRHTDDRIRQAIHELLQGRVPPATICPSEVARALEPQQWRPLMPQVRAVAVELAKRGALDIRQGGRTLDPHQSLRGPIRLGRPAAGSRKPARS